jgi:hypothetical protein
LLEIHKTNSDLSRGVKNIGDNVVGLVDDLKLKDVGTFGIPSYILDELPDINVDEKRSAILQWLLPVGPWDNHEAAKNSHQSGTSNWFIESKEFIEWHNADSLFLMLTGFRTY